MNIGLILFLTPIFISLLIIALYIFLDFTPQKRYKPKKKKKILQQNKVPPDYIPTDYFMKYVYPEECRNRTIKYYLKTFFITIAICFVTAFIIDSMDGDIVWVGYIFVFIVSLIPAGIFALASYADAKADNLQKAKEYNIPDTNETVKREKISMVEAQIATIGLATYVAGSTYKAGKEILNGDNIKTKGGS